MAQSDDLLPHDCILLAAGTSSRMGTPKQLLPFGGRALILQALETALACCARVIVVEGAVSLSEIITPAERVELIHNPRYAEGQLGSLQQGLKARYRESAFIMLADLPLVKPETYRRIAGQGRESAAVYPVCHGRRGHPVLVGPDAIELILQATPGERAMQVIRPLSPLAVEVDDPGIYLDADTPAALEKLRKLYTDL